MKSKHLLLAIRLLVLLALFIPPVSAGALAPAAVPPVDMFQLPWEQGISWMAIDGFDNGTGRPLNSSHFYLNGGAVDFAPRKDMRVGEDTSNFWVTAAAAGTVIEKSFCDLKIDHGNGWTTGYQFLGNIQVQVGDTVSRNQRLAVIADGLRQKFCLPDTNPEMPHVHFTLRPAMRDATFSGWVLKYDSFFNITTFTKNGQSLGLFKPLLNAVDLPTGPFVSTIVSPPNIKVGETATATINLSNVPAGGYTSAEFTCTYNAGLGSVSNIAVTNLFGADPAVAINGPQNGRFIVAVAGSNANKATASGTAFSFSVKGLQVGQTPIDCQARVSKGDSVLTGISSVASSLSILGTTPTSTSTPLPTRTPTSISPVAPTVTLTRTVTSTPTRSLTLTVISSALPTFTSIATFTPVPTSTPLPTFTPLPTATKTFTPIASPTSLPAGQFTGKVLAGKPVTVSLYKPDNTLAASVSASPDGTFSLSAPAGTYAAVATASGFLRAQGSVTLAGGGAVTLPTVSLLAGDIDNNNVVDQFDALTLGMNYNTAVPAAADLNTDGIVNVLDLELLARNYRKTGPIAWQ